MIESKEFKVSWFFNNVLGQCIHNNVKDNDKDEVSLDGDVQEEIVKHVAMAVAAEADGGAGFEIPVTSGTQAVILDQGRSIDGGDNDNDSCSAVAKDWIPVEMFSVIFTLPRT